ncbi:GDSL-type esterase/lipase family protein [Flavobacterium sp. TMP13]|uniref:SGNH/GDSL hydrolase family protein n=1 Tax=Flavobacterium sp. TMP13 TaxID=3425950 RepID=UPI003D76BA8D
MNLKNKILFIALLFISISSTANDVSKKTTLYQYWGRVEHLENGNVVLIGASSSITFEFSDENIEVFLQSGNGSEHRNYVSFELDGVNLGRFVIQKDGVNTIPIKTTKKQAVHRLTIYKATEASSGAIVFSGTTAHLKKFKAQKKKKVEFIGDSITCGFGNDASLYPCGEGEWYDQHNAYMSYGPQLARDLDFDYVLSSVSGIGIYRNWNEEQENEAVMSDVYENLHLNKDKSKPYNFDFQPDLVSICLGTNDLSDGDGKKERRPFNEDKFVNNYIEFIKTVYVHAPKSRIVLLNSPMISGDRNAILVRCLNRVAAAFANDKKHLPIAVHLFTEMKPGGCGSHPTIADDTVMANQLTAVFKELLHKK